MSGELNNGSEFSSKVVILAIILISLGLIIFTVSNLDLTKLTGNVVYYYTGIDNFISSEVDYDLPVVENFITLPGNYSNGTAFYNLSWDFDNSAIDSNYEFVLERWGPMKRYPGDSFPDPFLEIARLHVESTSYIDLEKNESIRPGAQYVYRIRVENPTSGIESNSTESWAEHRKFWSGRQVQDFEQYLYVFDTGDLESCLDGTIIDPEIIGRLGGNVHIDQTNIAYVDLNNISNNSEYHLQLRNEIALARKVAENNNVPIRFLMYARPDTLSFSKDSPPGYNFS